MGWYRNQSIVLFSTKSARLQKDQSPDQNPDLSLVQTPDLNLDLNLDPNPDPNPAPTKKTNPDLDPDQKQLQSDKSVILCMYQPSPSVPKRVLPQQSDRSTKHA